MPRSFGEYLSHRRKQLQLTRQRVADDSGLSYAYLAQLESGKKSSPSSTVLGQLARALRVPVEELAHHAGVDVDGAPLAARASGPPRRMSGDWHANPLHVPAPAAMVVSDMAMASDEVMPPSRARARRRDSSSELDAARDQLLPALEQLLAGYSPATRLALLNELQARAIRELG